MNTIILDASALLSLLKEEPGGVRVASVIASARMSAVNFAEVISHFVHNGMPAAQVYEMLRPLPIVIAPADADLARRAGRLRSVTAHAGLSLGDRFCLALAVRDGLPAWTADKQWQRIADKIDGEIITIR